MRVFRAAPGFFHYSVLKWGVGQAGALLGVVASTFGFEFIEFGPWSEVTRLAAPFLIGLFAVQLIASFAVLRLGYEMRWYIVSDRALRIRYGVYTVREQTMTVVNLQNMVVKRGPLQRLFGIADLEVHTASGGSADDDDDELSRGVLRGLDDADEVRDLLLLSLRRNRDAGLGDPDDPVAGSVPSSSSEFVTDGAPLGPAAPAIGDGPVLHAALEILSAARALRRTVSGDAR